MDLHAVEAGDAARWRHGTGRHREISVQEARVRDAAHVPQLQDDGSALGVDGLDDGLPAFDLRLRPDAGSIGIACALGGHDGGIIPALARCA